MRVNFIMYKFYCDFNINGKICVFVWIYLFIFFYGLPFSLVCVNCTTDQEFSTHHFNATGGDIYQDENQHDDFSDHQTKWKKVRKKNLDKYFSRHETIIPEKWHEMYNSNNFTFDSEEPLYLGYARNPFGSSVLWNKNYRSINNNNTDHSEKNGEENEQGKIREVRGKRGVTHLYSMLSCATGCNPLSYKGYGCYCGFLGSGKIIDGIDRCCMMHDVCYSSVNCPVFFVYFMPYLWRCWRGRPLCAVDHLGYGHADSCPARLCQCDQQLALCLARRPCPHKRALCTSSPWRLFQNIVMS